MIFDLSHASNSNQVIDEYLLDPMPIGLDSISAEGGTGVRFEDIRPYRYFHESQRSPKENKISSPKVKKLMSPRVPIIKIESAEPFKLNKMGVK